jgi:dTDP-4-amino-4,6-dideoxygalactose transaminase
LNLSLDSVRDRLTSQTKAILPVHLYGNPCKLPELQEVAEEKGLRLIEDACQAHGAKLKGKPVGRWGDAGCFSFYPTKNLGALGDGGMVTTDDPQVAEHIRQLRNGGQSSRYIHEEVGFNSRLDEVQAAILRAKLPRLNEWNRRRTSLAEHYRRLLKDTPVTIVPTQAGAEPVHHLFVVRTSRRDELQESLAAEGIQTLIHYPIPAHLQPAYRGTGPEEGHCPVAEKAAREIVSLPLYPELSESQVERVAEAVRAFFR